jgi:hypothetical protein
MGIGIRPEKHAQLIRVYNKLYEKVIKHEEDERNLSSKLMNMGAVAAVRLDDKVYLVTAFRFLSYEYQKIITTSNSEDVTKTSHKYIVSTHKSRKGIVAKQIVENHLYGKSLYKRFNVIAKIYKELYKDLLQ